MRAITRGKLSLYALAALLLGLIVGLGIEYQRYQAAETRQANSKAQDTLAALNGDIEALLSRIEDEANRLALKLGARDYSAQSVKTQIAESAGSIAELKGVTACYEPYAFGAETRLFCPFYTKETGAYVETGEAYDYSVIGAGTAWYTVPRDTGATWAEPYYGAAAKEWFIDYGAPFNHRSGPNAGQVRGVVDMSMEVGDFQKLVHALVVGKTGYGFIASAKGNFIAHPISGYVGKKTLADMAADEGTNAALRDVYAAMAEGKSGHARFQYPANDETMLVYYGQIGGASGWGTALVFLESDLMGDQRELTRRKIRLSLALSAFIVVLIALYFGRDSLDRREIEQLSWLTSALLLANIFFVGVLEHNTRNARPDGNSPAMIDLASLGSFIGQRETLAQERKRTPETPIPTGVYVERLEFIDSYNVNIGGKAWQRYPLEIADDVNVGFTFPQLSPFAESSLIEETYRERIQPRAGEPGYLLVGWDFRVTLLLNFQYKNYPFDKRHIDVQLAPLARQDRLLFTPDIESYKFTNPTRKPGMNPDIVISGNDVIESYFNYSVQSFGTDFGLGVNGLFEDVPVLHYNIHLRRVLLNAFVTSLIPIFVTLCFIYILISACEKSNERQGIIESMAAFFFVLVFSHIDLRKDIVTDELIFMEYFYFITYGAALASTFNLMTYTKSRSAVFDYNENQLYRAGYFPTFLALVLTVMLTKFY